jgi:TetR/AcrR family transcriptional repressor of nem operon
MRVSREQVAENRKTILEAAGRLFRERGYESVTVAEVMQAAGLTHGGFYGYFESKDALIAAALGDVLGRAGGPGDDLAGYVKRYLSPRHRDNRAAGCAVSALAAETGRLEGGARAEMTDALRRQIERIGRLAQGQTEAEKRRAAIGTWAAMVGAMILARVSDDAALSDEVLAATRGWLEGRK